MPRFKDQRLLEVYLYGHTASVPAEVCVAIQRELETLLAIPGWTGVDIVADVFSLDTLRLGIMVTQDWGISFEWREGEGAFELGLEP